jgi:uncharacterized protein HemX
MIAVRRFIWHILLALVLATACASPAAQQRRDFEKNQKKAEREQTKKYKQAKKRHFDMQTKEVQKRMRASERNYKKHQRERRK